MTAGRGAAPGKREADLLRKEPRGGESAGRRRHRPVEREGRGGQIRGECERSGFLSADTV